MALVDTIKSLVEEELEGSPYFLVEIIGGGSGKKIQVLVDGDEGINIDKCSQISRSISKVIDDEGFEADPFILEVSSPGADKPLKHERQYKKHVGRKLQIETTKQTIEGKLLDICNNELSLLVVEDKKKKIEKTVEIPLDDIIKTTVILSFK
ncbi:MAG: ribosome maturation factor RimP [Flavobacteriales bacterium]|nr:ribosome maturation factor RimP [Flavobacteriales bacterium]